MKSYEQQVAGSAGAVFSVSRSEQSYFEDFAKRVEFVPNGVPACIEPRSERENSVLFVGTLSYRPNLDAVLFLLDEIAPLVLKVRPQTEFKIIGRNPPSSLKARASENVRLLNTVEDISPYFARAGVLAVPLRAGAGTRFKILEAFAAGLPVVSTEIGAEGLGVKDQKELLISNSAEEFAESLCRVLENKALAFSLASRAQVLVKQQYLWESIVPKCFSVYQAISA